MIAMRRVLARFKSSIRGERGNVLVIVLSTLVVLFAFSGVAIDIGHVIAVKTQLQTAFDAGALAGAAQLAIDSSNLTAVRTTASTYAAANFFAGGTPTLSTPSDNSGNVKTGMWSGGTWTPAVTPPAGFMLNAVRCQWTAPVSTAFLGLIGITSINVSGFSTAALSGPATPCPGCAVLPLGLPQCGFTTGGSQGCGTLVWSDKAGGSVVWANLNPSQPANFNDFGDQIDTAYAGNGVDPSWNLNAGQFLNTTNSDVGAGGVLNDLAKVTGCPGGAASCGQFVTKYNASTPIQIKTSNGTEIYNGRGWEVVVPILDMSASACSPSGASSLKILTWTYFVVVQFINGGKCTVNNPGYSGEAPWRARCDNAAMGGTASSAPNVNILYGYYNCRHMDSPTTTEPSPIAGLATQPKMVQ